MKVLVLGGDGRAHAFVWKLFNSQTVSDTICAPGNGGAGQLAPLVDLDPTDAATVARWAFDEGVDLIVPSNSASLRAGVVDEVVSFHIGVCGPSQRSTMLEQSRCRAKEFMLRHRLPTAPGRPFTDLATAEKYLATQALPVIIKADHPEAGEGVYTDRHAALAGLRELFVAQPLEGRSDGVVIEQFVSGPRVVMSAFTDGHTAIPLLAARLYDRVGEGDSGPQAVGVGAHTGCSRLAQRLSEYLHQRLIAPIIAGLEAESIPFWGILGIDCIVAADGPRLTGIRSSMHEGEAQVVLPRLEDDLLPWIQAMIARRLYEMPAPRWSPLASVGIGLFAQGYPHHFPRGGAIEGIEDVDEGVLIFHSATDNPAALRYDLPAGGPGLLGFFGGGGGSTSTWRVEGGQPLMVVATGATLAGARGRALVNAERIRFAGRTYRGDIGAKELG